MPIQNKSIARYMYNRFDRYLVFKRFLKYVDIGRSHECWIWHGCSGRYGPFSWDRKHVRSAHQAAYELFIGSRGKLQVLHSCDNNKCVNPKHLFLGTQQDNIIDMVRKGRNVNHVGRDRVNEKIAKKIIKLYAKRNYTERGLARKFNLSRHVIRNVIKLQHWTISEMVH